MKQSIIKKVKELGLDDIAFTDFKLLDFYVANTNKFYAKSLDCPLNLTKEMLLNQVCDKQVENTKTVISVAMNYRHEKDNENLSSCEAIFSSSSFGTDYHILMKEKLSSLASFLKEKYNINAHIQVDNGNFDDRYWAYKSGLGAVGKNGMIIHEKYGSFIFLGELFIDKHIKSEKFEHKTCLGCNECIRKCPTNAIKNGNMNIENKRCLSYLSQAKEVIPAELGSKMQLLYGCDICNEVCPHNLMSYEINREVKDELATVDLLRFVKISNKEFSKTYGHLAGSWRGKLVLVRNALWILANRKYKNVAEVIDSFLKEPNFPKWFYESLEEIKKTL